jgi:hypothetical protein
MKQFGVHGCAAADCYATLVRKQVDLGVKMWKEDAWGEEKFRSLGRFGRLVFRGHKGGEEKFRSIPGRSRDPSEGLLGRKGAF